jgi:hypothetical protein
LPAVRKADLVSAGLRHGLVLDDASHHSIIARDPLARISAARRSHIAPFAIFLSVAICRKKSFIG